VALTMTRTRTQTTLTKLATRVANVHGELEFVQARMAAALTPEVLVGLARKRDELTEARDALYVTLRQFDPELDPSRIGALNDWLKPFGRGKPAVKRWEDMLVGTELSRPGLPRG